MRQSVNGDAYGAEALEASTIEGYRTAKLSAGEVAEILRLATSLEALDWLGRRGIALNYSREDYESDRNTLARLLTV
jgi:predicted HTH domain antitoxin